MIEYIVNHIQAKGHYITSIEELSAIQNGIKLYLMENGIEFHEKQSYYRDLIKSNLTLIDDIDLKNYFIEYESISAIKQIAIEFTYDRFISNEQKNNLYNLMSKINSAGLRKYIPISEIQCLLGKYI